MFTCQRLLVPLDGSNLAERALPPAFAIAQALSTDTPCAIHLLRVVPPLLLAIDPILYAETLSLSEQEAQEYLERITTEWANSQVPTRCDVVTGPVAESIATYAEENKIHLTVMSTHGRSGLSRWVYGSVAEKVLRQACCASLIIRQAETPPPSFFRHILVCLDGSHLAEQVLAPILVIARSMNARLTLLRVTPPAHLTLESHTMVQLLTELESLERDEAAAYLRHLLTLLPVDGLDIRTQTVYGLPAEAIIDFAHNEGIDLIALSSHGRSGISRWVYGSVAEKVLRGAGCATFIIRGAESPATEG